MRSNAAGRIGSGSWLGAGAVVLPGACIGRNVVIAAGSVVRGTVPDRCVVAGVPARVVRSYVPGDGWSPSAGTAPSRTAPSGTAPSGTAPSGTAPPQPAAPVSAWTGPGAAGGERVEGVAQPVDPPGQPPSH